MSLWGRLVGSGVPKCRLTGRYGLKHSLTGLQTLPRISYRYRYFYKYSYSQSNMICLFNERNCKFIEEKKNTNAISVLSLFKIDIFLLVWKKMFFGVFIFVSVFEIFFGG